MIDICIAPVPEQAGGSTTRIFEPQGSLFSLAWGYRGKVACVSLTTWHIDHQVSFYVEQCAVDARLLSALSKRPVRADTLAPITTSDQDRIDACEALIVAQAFLQAVELDYAAVYTIAVRHLLEYIAGHCTGVMLLQLFTGLSREMEAAKHRAKSDGRYELQTELLKLLGIYHRS